MRVIIDIEGNSLENVTKIWLIVCKDIDTGEYHVFRPETTPSDRGRFLTFDKGVSLYIGHNLLGYDWPVLQQLLGIQVDVGRALDTLIVSKLVDYPRSGHSVADYGEEFGLQKVEFNDFNKYSVDMETYCIRDVDITHGIYNKYRNYITKPDHDRSIQTEHEFQLVCNQLHNNGFAFDTIKASKLLEKVTAELAFLDKDILEAFQPRLKLIREITPKETKYGTISLTSIPKSMRQDVADLTVGAPFCYCSWVVFNPSSHSQIIRVLNEAQWRPIDKTKTHIDTEREYNKLRRRKKSSELDLVARDLYIKLQSLTKTGWKVNENNLETLPLSAPGGARLLAKRIMLEARRRTLTEWLELTWHEIEIEHDQLGILGIETNGKPILFGEKSKEPRTNVGVPTILKNQEPVIEKHISKDSTDLRTKTLLAWLKSRKINVSFAKENVHSTLITVIGQEQFAECCVALATAHWDGTRNIPIKYNLISQRIHGRFNGLGAWSHRMNHQNPNTANIPNEFDTAGKKKLYGKELRALWRAPKNRLLVGVDAEGIQLRIFAHYINDPEFTDALVRGRKDDKTDPHSLNQRILGSACKSRAAAKRFIYALLLGAGMGKLTEILGCSTSEAQEALDRLMSRYSGWQHLKDNVFPKDARRGFIIGLDGRKVRLPGDTEGGRRHLAMSGYLQNGEAVVMKNATLKWWQKLDSYDARLVNFVHDEWQVEAPNNVSTCIEIAKMMADSLEEVGRDLDLLCPLAGSYWNDDDKDYTIATNWSKTH